MNDTDSVSYEILFEQLVENKGMTDEDFCEKFGYDIDTLEMFWSGKMTFDDPEDVKRIRDYAREAVKSFQKRWKDKGYSPTDLLNQATRTIGIPYEKWTGKYWMRFANSVAGFDDLLDDIETLKGILK